MRRLLIGLIHALLFAAIAFGSAAEAQIGAGRAPGFRAGLRTFSIAAEAPSQLRVVTTQNRMNIGAETRNVTDSWVRCPIVIAADSSEIVLSWANWYNLGSGAGEFAGANAVTLLGVALERSANASSTVVATAPVTFSGGRTVTVPADANDFQSDPLPASAFGLPKFSSGEWYWIKVRQQVPSASGTIPYSDRAVVSASGSQSAWFDPAVTTASSVDTLGAFTSTGTAPGSRANYWCPVVLGRPLVDGPSEGGVGDSIMTITADNGANTTPVHGVGWFQRTRHDAGTAVTGLRPGILAGRVGAATTHFVGSNTRWRAWIKYARTWVVGLGTNDIGTSSSGTVPATTLTNLADIYMAIKAVPGTKVGAAKTIPRTSSTDTWATVANQTPFPGWGAGDKAAQLNDWIDARFADGTLSFKIDMTSVRDPTEPLKWRVTGAANGTTSDGTHPVAVTMEDMAVEGRAAFAAVPQ